MNNENTSRWGFPEGYAHRSESAKPVTPVVRMENSEDSKMTKMAVATSNKAVEVLENVVRDLRIEVENQKRVVLSKDVEITRLTNEIKALNTRLEQRAQPFAVSYASGGVVGGNIVDSINTRVQQAPEKQAQAITKAVATGYSAPLNPMTLFVEFLEELNVLEDYVKITTDNDISFDLLCNQYNPSDWISEVCTDDNEDYLEGWDDADELWQVICESDDLDSKEAYVE